MSSFITRFRSWLEPLAALVFVVLWLIAEAGRYHLWPEVVVLVGFGVAIGIARVAPAWSLGLIGVILTLQTLRIAPLPESTTWPVYLAIIGVAFVTGNLSRDRERVRWIALVLGAPFAGSVALLMAVPTPGEEPRWTSWVGSASSGTYIAGAFINIAVLGLAIYVGAWAVGFVLRLNVIQLHSRFLLQDTARDLALAETELSNGRDKEWIAQEVHDLLAHSLAVVTAQADGARLSPHANSDTKDAALLAISGAAREALVDMQALVLALREEQSGGPQPGLADLPALLHRLESAGMRVEVSNFGEPKGLTPARELAIFRILQESLTNSLRHAGTNVPARVAFDWRGPGLAISVTSGRSADGKPSKPLSASAVSGNGVSGMKERARLAGGWLTAGEVDEPDATFIVAAFFPTNEEPETQSSENDAESTARTRAGALTPQLERGATSDDGSQGPDAGYNGMEPAP